jgi:hypothetical protein
MDSMKGPGSVVISCQVSADCAIKLLHFVDGSWGIQNGDKLSGIWEPGELDECFRVFALQVGISDRHAEQTVVLRVRQTADSRMN